MVTVGFLFFKVYYLSLVLRLRGKVSGFEFVSASIKFGEFRFADVQITGLDYIKSMNPVSMLLAAT